MATDEQDEASSALPELRKALSETDEELIQLLARRQELATRIGQIKQELGTPIRDHPQEARVVERAEATARTLGLSPGLARQLMLLLIRESLTVQEQLHVGSSTTGSGKRALVIGGGGKIGGWFARFLASQGFAVEVADPQSASAGFRHHRHFDHSDLKHDVIVISTPLGVTDEILRELALRKPPGLVFDVGSLKTPLRDGLRALVEAGVSATSIHPMFGPDTNLLSDRHVIFVDVGDSEAVQRAKELFASTMATSVEVDLENHDRLIAYVLGLSHALNIAFFTALAESGETALKLAQLSSTTFDAQLEVASAVASEDPALYYEIQTLNDYGGEALSALQYAVERLRSVVRAADEDGFRTLMERGREYLDRLEGAAAGSSFGSPGTPFPKI